MSKATLMTPLYVSVAWTVMVTYQIFTQTAVSTALNSFHRLWPAAGEWLLLRIDMIIFVHAFAWVFVLSSVIPSLLLGKKRSVLVQFFVCLMLALVAFVIQDYISVYLSGQSQVLQGVAFLLSNPLLAVVYLSVPYLFMVTIDIRARRKTKKDEHMDKITAMYLERSGVAERESGEEEVSATDEYT
jgi:uncharacterized membrane protein